MGFSVGSYCKIWNKSVGDDGRVSVNISTSHKDQNGSPKKDFGSYCDVLYKAKDKIADVEEGDTIVLDSITVENFYNKETKQTSWKCKIFDFHKAPPKTE